MKDDGYEVYRWRNEYGPARYGRDALEVNNPVILYKSGQYGRPSQFKQTVVTKTTKTQVTTAEGTRHYRRNGCEVGHTTSYHPGWVLVAADEQFSAAMVEAMECEDQRQKEREAEKELKQARREAREHPFWTVADADIVAKITAMMDEYKTEYDAKAEAELERRRQERGW